MTSHALTGAAYLSLVGYLFLSLTAALYFRLRIERRRREFVLQLKSHRRELRAGGSVVVDQLLLRYDTPLTSYTMNIGSLFCSATIPSNYLLHTDERHGIALWYSMLSLLSGWWSPSGPLNTIHALHVNLRGGKRTTVAELIDGPVVKRRTPTPKPIQTPAAPPPQIFTGPNSASGKMLARRCEPTPPPSMEERIKALWLEEQSLVVRALIFQAEANKRQKPPPAQRVFSALRAHLAAERADKTLKSSKKLVPPYSTQPNGPAVEKSVRGG